MATMWGADVQQLIDCSRTFEDSADLIEQSRTTIDSSLGSTPWEGVDAEAFLQQWTGTTSPQLVNIATMLRQASGDLVRNADEQTQASGGIGGGGIGAGAGIGAGTGIGASYSGSGIAGLHADANGNLTFGPDALTADGEAFALAGAMGDMELSAQYGDIAAQLEASGTAGLYAGADGSLEIGPDGITAEGQADALAGAMGDFDTSVDVGEYGSIHADGEGVAGLYAGADGSFTADETGAQLDAEAVALAGAQGEVNAGAELDGIASADVGASGTAGLWADANANSYFELQDGGGISFGSDVGAHAGAGATGDLSTSVDVGDGLFGYSAGVSGDVGEVGGSGSFGVDLGADRVGFSVGGDIAAGLGLGGDVGFYFSPSGVADVGGDLVSGAGDAVSGAADFVTSPGSWFD